MRVVVAVSPRLLADVLARTLAADGLAVSTVESATDPDETYDVAVVSAGREREVRATHLVVLPPEGSGPGGGTTLALLRDALARLG